MQTAVKRANEYVQTKPIGKQAVKMRGNVAYINSDIVRYNRPATDVKKASGTPAKSVARPAAKTTAKPAVRTAAKTAVKTASQPRTGFVSTLIVLLIAFGALAILVSRYAIACSIGAQNNSLKSDIEAAQARVDELELKIELNDDLQYVQDTAENELDMTYPTQEQKIHIDKTADGE